MDQFNFVVSLDKDFLDFVAAMTGHLLSWPVAFVVVVAAFFRPLKRLISGIKSGKTPWFEFNIPDALIEADAAATDATIDAVSKRPATPAAPPTPPARTPTDAPASADTSADAPASADTTADAPASADTTADAPASGTIEPAAETTPNKPPAGAPDRALAAEVADRLDRLDNEMSLSLARMSEQLSRATNPESQRAMDELGLQIAQQWYERERARNAPVDVLLKAWQRLEQAIGKLYAEVRPSQRERRIPTVRQANELLEMGLIDDSFLSSLLRLKRIRDEVVHKNVDLSPSEAQAFSKTSYRLRGLLDDATGHHDA